MINLISSMLTNLGILKKINDVISGVNEHIDNKNNPHQVTAEQLGLAAAYTYQGDVDNFASLPTQGVQKGWVYNVKAEFTLNNEKYPAGTDVAWDGSKWNTLGGSLKGYIRKVNNIAPDSDSNVNIKNLIPTNIQTATDLNNIKTEGRYQCDTDSVAATLLNAPLRTAFYLDVYVNSSSQVKQVVTSSNVTPQVYIRTLVNNTWGSWRTVQFTTTVYNMTEIQNTANKPIKLTGSFSHKYHEIAGGNMDLRANVDVYWVTPATSDVGVTINLSNLIKQEGYSRFITLYVDGSKCPNLRTITYTNKPSGFTLMNEPEKMMGGMVNVIGIEIVGTGNIYTITNNGSGGSQDLTSYANLLTDNTFIGTNTFDGAIVNNGALFIRDINQGNIPIFTITKDRVGINLYRNTEIHEQLKLKKSVNEYISMTQLDSVTTDVVELKVQDSSFISVSPNLIWGINDDNVVRVCVLLVTGAGAPTIQWNCIPFCDAPTKEANKSTIVSFLAVGSNYYLVSFAQEVSPYDS